MLTLQQHYLLLEMLVAVWAALACASLAVVRFLRPAHAMTGNSVPCAPRVVRSRPATLCHAVSPGLAADAVARPARGEPAASPR